MLRWMTPFLVAIFAIGTAAAESPGATKTADGPAAAKPADSPAAAKPADNSRKPPARPPSPPTAQPRAKRAETACRHQARHGSRRPPIAARPAPRPLQLPDHGCPGAAPLYVRRGRALVVEEEDPDVLFTPVGVVPYAPRVFGTPLLPGSSTLPGYYGTSHSYSYDGPYYGGPYAPLLEPPAIRLRRVRILLDAH